MLVVYVRMLEFFWDLWL